MQRRYLLDLVILMAAISAGCGGSRGTHLAVPAGQLALTPVNLNFGKVPVGQQATKTGTITAGNAGIKVTSADWNGEGFSVSGISFPVTVPAGQSISFRVTFAPQKAGASSGSVMFLSDASNSPLKAALKANATQSGAGGTQSASTDGGQSGPDGTQSSSTDGSQSSGHAVVLSWRSAGANVVGYNVYRGPNVKGPFTKINSSPHPKSSFTDTSVKAGATYVYVTTAVNQHGKESKGSNQVQVKIPNS